MNPAVSDQRLAIRNYFLVVLSAVLLVLSFPKTNFFPLAWFAFVPLFSALDKVTSYKKVFLLSYTCGLLFFWGACYWFIYVTAFGAFLLLAYLAVYFGLFGMFYRYLHSRAVHVKVLGLASAWVVLEYIRSYCMTGFGWASLGHSQTSFLPIIQIADLTSFYGVSFLVMLVNVVLHQVVSLKIKGEKVSLKVKKVVRLTLVGLLCVFVYGQYRIGQDINASQLKVAVVQGNVQQDEKWDENNWPALLEKHLWLTKNVNLTGADLVVWPETALPGYLDERDPLFFQLKEGMKDIHIPLLAGSIAIENGEYFNSAILFSASGDVKTKYDKIHLVPFGEYFPMRGILSSLAEAVGLEDFTPGREKTLFSVLDQNQKAHLFATLICFEDTLEKQTRQFVKQGAEFLVNVTNDAWFRDTKAPFLHLQAAIFRSIENRRSLVRAANTGVSVYVDPKGRVVEYLQDEKGQRTFVPGTRIFDIQLTKTQTFYTQYGDIFVYLCIIYLLLVFVYRPRKATQ